MTQGIKRNGTLKIAFSEPISLYNTGCNGSNDDRVRNEPCFKFVYVSAIEPTQWEDRNGFLWPFLCLRFLSAASDHKTLCLEEDGALIKVDKVSVCGFFSFFFFFLFFFSQRHVALHGYVDWEHYWPKEFSGLARRLPRLQSGQVNIRPRVNNCRTWTSQFHDLYQKRIWTGNSKFHHLFFVPLYFLSKLGNLHNPRLLWRRLKFPRKTG